MRRATVLGWASILGGLLLSLFINYHGFLANFNLVPGDQGDTRLVVFTLEHWFSALRGGEPALQLRMFYPDPLALGYADGLFLFALPYIIFRVLGLDYFSSYQLVLVALSVFGFAMYVLLFRHFLNVDVIFAVLAATILTSLNALQFQVDIGKLIAFHFWPALILLLYGYARAGTGRSLKALAYLGGFAAGLGLLFFTSYYPAWYFAFTAVLYGLLSFLVAALRTSPRTALGGVTGFIKTRAIDLSVAVGVFVVALIPFWLTYAPLIFSNASRSFDLVLSFLPRARDILNVSGQNDAWSPILARIGFDYGNREVQLGSPWLVLVLFAVFGAFQARALVVRRTLPSALDTSMLVVAGTGILIYGLVIKVHGASLWYLVYRLAPGASALRAAGRYLMVIDMIVVAVVVYHLNRTYRGWRDGASPCRVLVLNAGLAVVAACLIAEQANSTAFRLDKAAQLDFMGSFNRPAADCQAFFIDHPSRLDLPVGYYQLDAMMVGMKLGLPTINGYSGIGPDPAFSMAPSGAEYQYDIMNWLRAHRALTGICALDYQSRTFSTVDVNSEYARYIQVVRDQYLQDYTDLFGAVRAFVRDRNDPSNLYPQYLEQHGYLDPSLGFQTGNAFHWIANKYWIGSRPCGKNQCAGIGIVGSYVELEEIIEGYGPKGTEAFFPYPQKYDARLAVPPDMQGELLIIFPAQVFAE